VSQPHKNLLAAYNLALAQLGHSGFDDLSESDRVLVTIWGLEADVNNGGFDQYFFNSSGDHAFFAERALRLIAALKMADIVARAVALFGADGVPRDRYERQEAHEQVRVRGEDLLDDLDRQFYSYPDDLSALVEAYLRRASGAG
jgi:hypothetical protein